MAHSEDLRYQVFVSSTFRDLQEERQKVLQAILEVQAFPAGMELFPAADDEQFEFIKREIQSSDYYLLIVAGKYGSVAADGVSFTEKEYNYAVEIGKPIISFLFHDLGELKGALLEQTSETKAKLDAFRDKVRTGRLVKFYRNGDDLKAAVLQALISAFRSRPGEGWVRAKNGSRIDDLREINELRKRLMVLEAENAAMKTARDPRKLLAHGTDVATWLLTTERMDSPFEFSATWDELLMASFNLGDFPNAHPSDVTKGVKLLLEEKVRQSGGDPKDFYPNLDSLLDEVKQQFVGLGYINIEDREETYGSAKPYKVGWWILTSEGKIQIALLRGHLRSNSST